MVWKGGKDSIVLLWFHRLLPLLPASSSGEPQIRASDPNDVGITVAQMSHPLVGVGTAAGSERQPEEAHLEARACVPGKFKREAGGAQPQRRGRGGGSLARRPRETWNIHL